MANEKRLIDANAWKAFYKELKDKLEVYDPYYDGYEDALDNVDDWIDAQPAVDAVEVVHGRWIKYKLGWDDFALRFKCSACDHRIYERAFNYCPNCGAKMDLEVQFYGSI